MAQKLPQTTPIIISDDLVYVKVHVNGRGPYNFIIDSNMHDIGRLDFHVARELNLNITGYQQITEGTTVKRDFLVNVTRLELGQVAHHNLKVIVSEYNATPKQLHIDGVLGREFFASYLLKIDGPGRQLILSKEHLTTQENGVLAYTKAFLVTGKIGQRDLQFNLDTGSNLPFQLPASALTGIHYANTPNQLTITRSNTPFVLQEAILNDEVWLGTVKLKEQGVYYSNKVHQISVGEGFLKEHVLILDQRNRLVRID